MGFKLDDNTVYETLNQSHNDSVVSKPHLPWLSSWSESGFIDPSIFLQNRWNLLPKYAFEFWVVSGVSVGDVQDSYLVWATLEMGGYVFAVGWFHDEDKVSPVDEFLCQESSSGVWCDSSGFRFPNPLPALK
jgi:hypothetical protein